MRTFVNTKNVGAVASGTNHLDPTGGPWSVVKYAKVAMAADDGAANIVAAVTGKKIRLLAFNIQMGGTGTLTLQWSSYTGTTNTVQSGAIPCSATAGTPAKDSSDFGLLETASGSALRLLTTGTSETADGYIAYCEI